MAAKKSSGPKCACGEVVFELTDKQPGAILRCPWCQKRYRLKEDGAIVPLAAKPGDAAAPVVKAVKPVSPSGRKPGAGDEADDATVPLMEAAKPTSRSQPKPVSRSASKPRRDEERGDEKNDSSRTDRAAKSPARRPLRAASQPEPVCRRLDETVEEEEGGVEVFRFDSEAPSAQRETRRKVVSSKFRSDRSSDIAREPTEPLRRISRRTRREEPPPDENAGDDELYDELPPRKPLDLEKWVFRLGLGMVPVGTVVFMLYVIYGVFSGQRDFVTYRIFGVTIRGDNPWVWFGSMVLGGLLFLGIWIGYVYFFVHKQKQLELEKKRRKEMGAEASSSSRRSKKRSYEAGDE